MLIRQKRLYLTSTSPSISDSRRNDYRYSNGRIAEKTSTTWTYTWDNNGNLLSDGTNSYTYNAAQPHDRCLAGR